MMPLKQILWRKNKPFPYWQQCFNVLLYTEYTIIIQKTWSKLRWNIFFDLKHSSSDKMRANLRWLTTIFRRVSITRYDCLPDVIINSTCTNDASNPKKKQKPLRHFKGVKSLWYICSNSFKLCSNMQLSLRPKTGKGALIYSCFLTWRTWHHERGHAQFNSRLRL